MLKQILNINGITPLTKADKKIIGGQFGTDVIGGGRPDGFTCGDVYSYCNVLYSYSYDLFDICMLERGCD